MEHRMAAYIVIGNSARLEDDVLWNGLRTVYQQSGEPAFVYGLGDEESTEPDVPLWRNMMEEAEGVGPRPIGCDTAAVHQALDSMSSIGSSHSSLTLLWFFQSVHSEDEELLGAVLRAHCCHDSRVIAVLADPSLEEELLCCWICHYVSPVVISSVDELTVPLWRGELLLHSSEDDPHVQVEVIKMEDERPAATDSSDMITAKEAWQEGACLELVSSVDTSTVHSCMLGDMFRLNLIHTGDTDVSAIMQDAGCVVRMVLPRASYAAAAAKFHEAKKLEKITTTEMWISYVLKGQLAKPDCRPPGPVNYKYFLMYAANDTGSGSFLFYEFDTTELARLLVSIDSLLLSADTQWCFDVNTASLYNECRDVPLSQKSLATESQQYRDAVEFYLERGDLHIENPQAWAERLALYEYERRKQNLLQSDEGLKKKVKDSPVGGCVLTLDTVRKHFTKEGLAKDSKYHLQTGNQEKSGLRNHCWPQSTLHYGPGISYHVEDVMSRLDDPRLGKYRDRRSFSETASLFTTEAMPSAQSPLPLRRRAKAKRTHSTRQSPRRTNNSSKLRSVSCQRSVTPIKRKSGGSSIAVIKPKHIPAVKTSTQPDGHKLLGAVDNVTAADVRHNSGSWDGRSQSLSAQKSVNQSSQSAAQPQASGGTMTSREQRAERNQRNEQRMRTAVEKALLKKGMKRSDKLYGAYSKELYILSMRGVRKLKTSVDLEKKMREIANVYAPAAIMTVNMKL